jgi:hypothetical protein
MTLAAFNGGSATSEDSDESCWTLGGTRKLQINVIFRSSGSIENKEREHTNVGRQKL